MMLVKFLSKYNNSFDNNILNIINIGRDNLKIIDIANLIKNEISGSEILFLDAQKII